MVVLTLAACTSTTSGQGVVGKPAYLRGVNVYTLEAARHKADQNALTGEPASSYRYLAKQGVSLIRLAVPWSSLQPVAEGQSPAAALNEPVDSGYLAVVKREVDKATAAGLLTVLDLHNPCGFPEGPGVDRADHEIYCGKGISVGDVTAIWLRLSEEFRDNNSVIAYDLFNEPSLDHVSMSTYKRYSQAVVTALRDHHDTHQLWVESPVHESFDKVAPKGPWIHDPLRKIIYSAHFYPDYRAAPDFAPASISKTQSFLVQVERFGNWCNRFRVRCSIGELGWPGNARPGGLAQGSVQSWNALGAAAYRLADNYRLDVTYFGASSTSENALWAFGYTKKQDDNGQCHRGDRAICTAFSQAAVVKAYPSE